MGEVPAEDSAGAAEAVSSQVCVHRILAIGILIQNRCEIWCELPLTNGAFFYHYQSCKNLRLRCGSLPAVSSSRVNSEQGDLRRTIDSANSLNRPPFQVL